ncbi:hypothetical protein K4L44_11740 [Halosquirtibacter laminarini]|uniref:Uncharacterized protein n=1 Tax=Halosquirtibacter laminarini TaxID=3374600 RepID=A0AC61NCK5_9BACT|nr:hypothetical protein K4L44_11740 [Prolixibacteraceae bacterium]
MDHYLDSEIDLAISEEDILSMRNALIRISSIYLNNHEVPFNLVERFLEDDLEGDERRHIDKLQLFTDEFNNLVILSQEIDNAISELKIMELRNILPLISKVHKPLVVSVLKSKDDIKL